MILDMIRCSWLFSKLIMLPKIFGRFGWSLGPWFVRPMRCTEVLHLCEPRSSHETNTFGMVMVTLRRCSDATMEQLTRMLERTNITQVGGSGFSDATEECKESCKPRSAIGRQPGMSNGELGSITFWKESRKTLQDNFHADITASN